MFIRTASFTLLMAASAAATADSEIDTSFGIFSTGHNVISINQGGEDTDNVAEVLTAPDGSLYLVGTSSVAVGQSRISVVHLLANGQVDLDFGDDGRYVGPSGIGNVTATAAAFNSAGDIIVAGTRHQQGGDDDFTVCKFRGASVTQFSALGTPCATVDFDLGSSSRDTARDLLVLPDGRFALAGSAVVNDTTEHAAVAVIKPDGTPDTSFGPGGKRHWLNDNLRISRLYGAAFQSGGILYAVGESFKQNSADLMTYVTRITLNNGTLLGDAYELLGTAHGPAYLRDVAIRPNGEAVAAGGVLEDGQISGVVVRLLPTGAHDPDWSAGNGFAPLRAGNRVEFSKLVAQTDGKYLVAGTLYENNSNTTSLFVARYTASGARDVSSFNLLLGYREIDFQTPGVFDNGAVLTLQNGRPVVAGAVQASAGTNDFDFGVARLRNDLIFSSGFGNGTEF